MTPHRIEYSRTSRLKRRFRAATAVAAVASLGGCATMEPMTPFDMAMAAGGAALGAYTGSFFAGGITNTMMMASGAIVGGYGVYKLGRLISQGDKMAHADATKRALTAGRDGELHEWRNAETGYGGFVRTVGSYRAPSGELCRRFRAGAAVEKDVITGEGLACEIGQGQWRVLHDDLG